MLFYLFILMFVPDTKSIEDTNTLFAQPRLIITDTNVVGYK